MAFDRPTGRGNIVLESSKTVVPSFSKSAPGTPMPDLPTSRGNLVLESSRTVVPSFSESAPGTPMPDLPTGRGNMVLDSSKTGVPSFSKSAPGTPTPDLLTGRGNMVLESSKTGVPSFSESAPSTPTPHEGKGTTEAETAQPEELKPLLQQHYTSLRDLIAVSPPRRRRGAQDAEWCDVEELEFKDKLLKLAARAYLQPIVRRESAAPRTHSIAQYWIAFTSTNRSLVVGLIEGLHRQADACVKFVRAQTFKLLQKFKPQQHVSVLQ